MTTTSEEQPLLLRVAEAGRLIGVGRARAYEMVADLQGSDLRPIDYELTALTTELQAAVHDCKREFVLKSLATRLLYTPSE